MKNFARFFQSALILIALIAINSCQKFDEKAVGSAEFALSFPGDNIEMKSGTASDSTVTPFQLMISVADLQGNMVLTDKLIPVYPFGTGFVSEKIEIRTGEFKLTKFMVINPEGHVVFASPVAGSPLAYLTTQPLPLKFNIFPGQVTQVVPEVLAVGDQAPDKFGYVNFGVSIIKPLTFWAGAVIDNPMIMAPFPFWTEARLTVYAKDGWHYTFPLVAGVNRLVIRGGSEFYRFVLEKEGFLPQKFEFKPSQLVETTKESPLYLIIPWDAVPYQTMVMQPGPDAGKDAMISNLEPEKNFGGHKYFEATFITEPVLTVMRTNNSLIAFNRSSLPQQAKIRKVVLRLSYEFPLLYDSTILSNQYFAWFGGVLQQVVEPWEESQVTWNNKPKTIEANQVFISPFIRNVNFIDVDVTRLFVPLQEIAAPNYGMLFRQWPSDQFPGFRFASSDYPVPAMRPRLTVYYTVN